MALHVLVKELYSLYTSNTTRLYNTNTSSPAAPYGPALEKSPGN